MHSKADVHINFSYMLTYCYLPTTDHNPIILFPSGLTLDSKKTHDCWDPDIEKGDKSADSSQGFRGEHTLLVKQVSLNNG